MQRHQEGTISTRTRKDGTTAFRLFWWEQGPDGSPEGSSPRTRVRWKKHSRQLGPDVTTRKKAREELAELLLRVNSSVGGTAGPVQEASVTFDDLVTRHWDAYQDAQGMRPSTRDGYRSCLTKWIQPFFGSFRLQDITPEIVSDFMGTLRKAELSDKYRKNIYNLLGILFDLAQIYNLIGLSPIRPKVHRPRVERKEKTLFPLDRLEAFSKALPDEYKLPLYTLMATGVRQGELLGLTWGNLDFEQGIIRFTHVVYRGERLAGLKTKGEHKVFMGERLASALLGYKGRTLFAGSDDFVFCRADGRPLDPDHLRRSVIYPALKQAGIAQTEWGSGLHAFRHLAGSKAHEKYGLKAAQALLGHTNIQTTANVYVHLEDKDYRETAKGLEESFGGFLN
jgi:integrase